MNCSYLWCFIYSVFVYAQKVHRRPHCGSPSRSSKTGQTSNCIARVLFSYPCRPSILQTLSHVFNFMYTTSLTELIHEILALFKLPQVLPLTPVGPRFHLMGLFTSEKLNTCPSVCKTEVLVAKPRHTLPFYLLLAWRTYKMICFYLDLHQVKT